MERMKKLREKLAEQAGFTLVELIVVIAILGILAAVAVPAYTGYITKAKEANDTQLLSAVNTAFAAACVENGVAPADVTATATVSSDKKITGITVSNITNYTGDALTAKCGEIAASFNVFFAGNTNTALGYYTGLTYSTTTHNFEGTDPTSTSTPTPEST